jgi:hypothetical protein
MVTLIFAGRKSLIIDVFPRQTHLNQDDFLAIPIPELSRDTTNVKHLLNKNPLLVPREGSLCDMGAKFRSLSTERQL